MLAEYGASWEGWVLEQLATLLELDAREMYFWGLHTGAELDLLVHRDSELTGYEIKRSSAPTMTRSLHTALRLLEPTEIVVVHAGEPAYDLADRCAPSRQGNSSGSSSTDRRSGAAHGLMGDRIRSTLAGLVANTPVANGLVAKEGASLVRVEFERGGGNMPVGLGSG